MWYRGGKNQIYIWAVSTVWSFSGTFWVRVGTKDEENFRIPNQKYLCFWLKNSKPQDGNLYMWFNHKVIIYNSTDSTEPANTQTQLKSHAEVWEELKKVFVVVKFILPLQDGYFIIATTYRILFCILVYDLRNFTGALPPKIFDWPWPH